MKIAFEKYRWLLLLLLATGIYSHTFFHDFVYDDKIVLVENSHVTSGPGGLSKIWTTNYLNGYQQFNDALYRPLSQTVFNLTHLAFGSDPMAFHIVNVLFYTLLTGLLYRFFCSLFPGRKTAVFRGVLLFAVHPIHTEVVANIKSLDEILALTAGVSAGIWVLKIHNSRWAWIGVLISYSLALLAKESAIAFLILLPAFSFFAPSGFQRKKLILLFGCLAGITAAWYTWHEHVISSMPRAVDEGLFAAVSNSIVGIENPLIRFITGMWLVTKYFLKLLVPWPLSGDYSFNSIPAVSLVSLRFLSSLVFIGGSAYIFFKGFFKKTPEALAVLIFFTAVLPVSNVLVYIGTTFAERLAFTASMALIPLAVGLQERFKVTRPILYPITFVFAVLTMYRAAQWKDNLTLFAADARHNPHSYRTHYNYGTALSEKVPEEARTPQEKKYLDLAIAEYQKSLEIMPTFADAILNLGNAYKKAGRFQQALDIYDQLIRQKQDYARAYFNKGIVLYQMEQYQEARETFLQYTTHGRQNLAAAWYWAGVCSGYLNEFDTAIRYLEQSLQHDPSKWEAWNYLGMAYGNSQNWQKAVHAFRQARQLNASPEIINNLKMAEKAWAESR